MKLRVFVAVVTLVAAFVVGAPMAYAQRAVAQIDFPFVAGGKDMPSGKYSFDYSATNGLVTVAGPTGSVMLPIITTLGRHDLDKDPEFVFDKVEGKLLLSEVWMPGQDGYLLLATKGPHAHAVVGGSNPRK